jgi:signal transduction histidine kinase
MADVRTAPSVSTLARFDGLRARVSSARVPALVADARSSSEGHRRDIFVATLAHELRQPLSAMAAAVEIVRDGPVEAARRVAGIMERQLAEMSRLVEDLVDATRLANGKVSIHARRVDLRGAMRDAVADVEPAVARGGHHLVVLDGGEPLWIDGDPQRLLQVLTNLLRNALKYTPSGGRITMMAARVASTITLTVRDTGRGIEPELLPHVFDLFSQMRPHEDTGLGLGLSIAREIVILHGGSIGVRSEGAGKGSEFVVRLPAAAMLELRAM